MIYGYIIYENILNYKYNNYFYDSICIKYYLNNFYQICREFIKIQTSKYNKIIPGYKTYYYIRTGIEIISYNIKWRFN